MSSIGDLFAGHGSNCIPVPVPRQEEPLFGPVFFAIRPDPGSGAQAAVIAHRLRAAHRLMGDPITPERLHVTLLLIGYFPMLSNMSVEAACSAAAAIDTQAFEITLDHAMTFNTGQHKNPVVLTGCYDAPGVALLRRALIAEMRRRGVPHKRVSRYTPHMTLLYDCHPIRPHSVEPVRWTVREFVLIHSHYGYSRHVPLACWQLRN